MPMRCPTLVKPVLLWALLAAVPALAQDAPVYRCGNSYQAKPCTGGVTVDAADPRSEAQRLQAQAASRRDAALARQMSADRRAAEREAARSGGPANLGPRAALAPAKAASAAGKTPKKPKSVKAKRAPAPGKAATVKRP